MSNRLTPYLFLLMLVSSQAFGQGTCTQTLRFAQATYESGKLHELAGILSDDCLKTGFNTEERRQAYKLLVQSYIYLEEPEKADSAMLNLLTTDAFFRPNPDVDPAEFVSLYNRFRHDPLFRAGLKVGGAFNAPHSTKDYYVGGDARGTSVFSPLFTFSMGAMFEKDFLATKQLTIAPEIVYMTRAYKEAYTMFLDQQAGTNGEVGGEDTNAEVTVKIKSIDVNALVKWWLVKTRDKRDQKIDPYLIGGPGVNLVLSAALEDAKLDRFQRHQGTNTGPAVNVTDVFNPVNFSGIVGAGFRRRLGKIFLNMDVRANIGLNNAINPEKRTNADAVFEYGWIPNDTFLNSVTVNIALQMAYFRPMKLVK